MDLDLAQRDAEEMIRYHIGTERGWTFQFDNAPRRFGYCHYTKKLISLSKKLTRLNSYEEVHNTILHEIAHALNFEIHDERGHGPNWVNIARSIGCDGLRCYSSTEVNIPPRFVALDFDQLFGD
jgi:predicted SprT family Zn-dependent metalloprotease